MRKRWFAAATAVALALLLVSADGASAQRWRGGRWGGGYGGMGYGSGYYGGLGYGSGYYGGMGYGSGYYGGLGYGGYGWGNYYPSTTYGYGFSPGYSSPGFAPSYGYPGSFYTPGYASSAVTTLPGGTMSLYYQPGAQVGAGYGSAASNPNEAVIDLRVPADAQVWFDGDATTQRGPNRVFNSPPLEPGRAYHYDVRAQWTENGRTVNRTRRVDVRAGQRTTVDFTQDQGTNPDVNTDSDLNRDRNLDRDRNRTNTPDRGTGTNPNRGTGTTNPGRGTGTNPGGTGGTNPNRTGGTNPNRTPDR